MRPPGGLMGRRSEDGCGSRWLLLWSWGESTHLTRRACYCCILGVECALRAVTRVVTCPPSGQITVGGVLEGQLARGSTTPRSRRSRARSRGDVPAQMPTRSGSASAWSRHSPATGQAAHTWRARPVTAPRPGKNAVGPCPRHAARSIQAGGAMTRSGRSTPGAAISNSTTLAGITVGEGTSCTTRGGGAH